MTPAFDLLTEPWIPVIATDGAASELGLRDLLVRAHELAEIFDPAPPVTAALHRLALAVLHRVFGPDDVDAWGGLWRVGRFETPRIDAYLDRWGTRFDLFDETHPFYQAPGLGLERAASPATLVLSLASGNNATLFDHTSDDLPVRLMPAEAARWLVCLQSYAPGGLVSFEEGQVADRSARAGPLVKGSLVLLTGSNLFETLMLNLVRYSPTSPFAQDLAADAPAWERDEPTRAEERVPVGYLDLLTWQSRRVLLRHADDGGSVGVVDAARIMKGNQMPESFPRWEVEPMVAFRVNPRARATEEPFTAIEFEEQRALWRDSPVFFSSLDSVGRRPRTVGWIGDLAADELLPWTTVYRVTALGLVARRAKLLFWRHDRMPMPLSYLDPDRPVLLETLRQAVELGEEVGRLLDWSARSMAARVLPPGSDAPARSSLARRLAPGVGYWPRLDAPFHGLLEELPRAEQASGQARAVATWEQTVREVAVSALSRMLHDAGDLPRVLKAGSSVELAFRAKLARLMSGGEDSGR